MLPGFRRRGARPPRCRPRPERRYRNWWPLRNWGSAREVPFHAGEWREWWGHCFRNMRLDINLASQPYEDARQFWLRWGGALVAAGIFTLVLLVVTVSGWFNARRDRIKVDDLRQQISKRDEA